MDLVAHYHGDYTWVAVTAEQCCMSGRRFDTEVSGLMSREMHGPVRGVRRRMIRS